MSFSGIANAMASRRRPDRKHSEKSLSQPGATHGHSRKLRSIVVPLDGTNFSEHAIPVAIAIAKRSASLVKLVHVFSPTDRLPISPGMTAFDVLEAKLRLDSRQYLEGVQRRIARKFPEVTVITHLIESRNIAKTLAGLTADLVVMATHDRGWLGRLFFGSIARKVMLSRKGTTICVRGHKHSVDLSADPVPLRVTVALDGRDASERMLSAVDTITQLSGARWTLLHLAAADELELDSTCDSCEPALSQTP